MRIELKKGKQRELISEFKKTHKLTWLKMSKLLGVNKPALIGWAKEQNLIPLIVYEKLVKKSKFYDHIIQIKKDNWGQSKGGLISRGSLKSIRIPRKSEKLAELIGIILGDGNIHSYKKGKKVRTYMLRIAGDKRKEYIYFTKYVAKLIEDLFGIESKIEERKTNEILIIVHSKQLIEFLVSMGLKDGNKIKNQTTIPKWIFKDREYIKACIRGLIDTDGCIYALKPHYPDYYQLSFKNHNITLLNDLRKAFLVLGYPISKISKHNQLYLTQQKFINKFYKEIGFSNMKHINRYKK